MNQVFPDITWTQAPCSPAEHSDFQTFQQYCWVLVEAQAFRDQLAEIAQWRVQTTAKSDTLGLWPILPSWHVILPHMAAAHR